MSIANCNSVTSYRRHGRDNVHVPEETSEKVGDVGTKRNAVEECGHPGGCI